MAGYYWDQNDNAERDAPLRFAYHAPELAQILGLRADDDDHECVLNTILTELCLAAEADQALSYSRRMASYTRSRYRPFVFGYTMMMRVVDQIVDAGLADENRTRPGVRGWQSTIRATTDLYEAWLGMGVEPEYDASGETLVLKTRKTKTEPARLLEYADTMKHVRLRKALRPVIEMLAATEFGGLDSYRVRPNLLRFEKQAFDRYGRPITRVQHVRMVPANGGRRIFCQNLNQHGRFYVWPQNLPNETRAVMTLNGERTTEIDYSAHHVRLAYSMLGKPIDGDAYDVGGDFIQDEVKVGTLISLNAGTPREAAGALVQARAEKGERMPWDRARRLIEAVRERHAPIERAICNDFGVTLMRADSDIILGVTTDLEEAGIASLPIHDSIITKACFASQAMAKMEENWHRFAGHVNPCKVKKIR
jgi:hypothetical protein